MTIQRAYLCDCRVDISRDPQGVIRYCSSHKAAPALLQALERCRRILDGDDLRDAYGGADSYDDATEQADAAIAQARGEK